MEYGKGGYAIIDGSFLTSSDLADLVSGSSVAPTPEQFESIYAAVASGKPLWAKLSIGGDTYYPCGGALAYDNPGVSKAAVTHVTIRDFNTHADISFELAAVHNYTTDVYSLAFSSAIIATP